MNSGFDNLSLAIFTTLTPAGIVAFICVSMPLLVSTLDKEKRTRLNHWLALPYTLALIGFIASATHLGTPSNALYVFMGVGRSPLSNEVLCAVLFLFIAGAYWMSAYRERLPLALSRIWLGVACCAGIALLLMTSLAYSVETVITWYSWLVPVNLWLSALLAGPVIGALTCTAAQVEYRRYSLALCIIALLALIAGTLFLLIQYESLAEIANHRFSAHDLVPHYHLEVALHVVCGVTGLALAFYSLKHQVMSKRRIQFLIIAALVLLVAVFIPREMFYALHMTAGF